MNKRLLGNVGEDLARTYLEAQGFKFIEKNQFLSRGEIDLIMNKDSYLYFIEVKYRRTLKYGSPREAMTASKIRSLKSAVSEYLYKNGKLGIKYKISFMGIHEADNTLKYDWLENIFGD